MTLKEMQEKREKLVADGRAALNEITANTDESRTTELEQRHDAIMSEFDQLDRNIAREQRMAKLEQEATERREKQRPIGPDTESRSQDEGDKVEYRDVFYKFLAEGGDPSALSPEERAILRGGAAKDEGIEKRIQTAGTTTAGGFTVPTELANFIVESMKATGPMYDGNIVTDITTSGGNPIKVPTVDDTAQSGARRDEGGEITDDGGVDVVFGQKSLDAYVFDTEFLRISMELLADSAFNVEQLIGGLLGKRLGRIANSQLTTGDGVGDPNGVVTASSLGKTSAAIAAITFDEILDLEHSVDPAYRASPKCAYQFNDSTLLAVRKLKDSEGRYIWQAGNVQQGVPATLNGRVYHINQAIDALAAAKKVMLFGDFGAYFVRKVGSPVVGVLRERFWPDLGMAGLIRFDGELSDAAAVKHLITAAA
jgi:HK97 family phage major capsid protein